ncbi:hypothetical protein C8J57DRAFT_1257224 [Mycena rebaudengoi]|nr:hypothetical protein C8J57DRAFT_1257224 [Mycena rebaudengoi]
MSTERPTTNADSITDKEIEDELCLLDLEDADSLLENVHDLVFSAKDDFPDDGVNDEAARYAAKMTKASITDGTRTGHLRDITAFITQKCGPVEEGFEGRKYSTAVYSRAALKMWYRSIRPNESLTEWHLDPGSNTWRGLPTRSRHVSQFMVGLEKTKAKSGEVSSSARALSLDDIHSLHDWCMKPGISLAQRRSGIIRYLMLLRIDEIIKLQFENIDNIVGERLNTRKSAQTGLLHSWRLFANDDDPKICPVRGLILLATLYKPQGVEMTGPLFLRVSAQQPMV